VNPRAFDAPSTDEQRQLISADASPVATLEVGPTQRSPRTGPDMRKVWIWRIAVLAVMLVGWQEVPKIPGITGVFKFEDTFFISSPTRIAKELWLLASGSDGTRPIWGALARTVLTALVGTAASCVLGAIAGLAVSNWAMLEAVARPFVVLFNAIPRIAMIPVIVLLVGGSTEADALTALTVVFFLIFYSALEGASSVPREIIQNAELLGASKLRIMWRVRWPYALGWTMAALPNAIAFGLVGSVTAEIFTGAAGLGYQLTLAIDNSNATLLFSIVVILAVIGVILVLGSTRLRRALLPWWETSQGL
jgi:NitT/TauT family transport system permease protein